MACRECTNPDGESLVAVLQAQVASLTRERDEARQQAIEECIAVIERYKLAYLHGSDVPISTGSASGVFNGCIETIRALLTSPGAGREKAE